MKNKLLSFVTAFLLLLGSSELFAGMVNINKADAETLASNLSGIGASKAAAIVDYRNQHGPFKSIDDVQNIKGIGEKTFELIKSDLSLTEGATTQ